MKYPDNFEQLVKNHERKLLDGSFFMEPGDYISWKIHRIKFNEYINADSEILDIGCANGFLLRCLIEWSEYDIIPYGYDIQSKLVSEAKLLHREFSDNFWIDDFRSPGKNKKKYDIVIWSILDRFEFKDENEYKLIDSFLEQVAENGSLILSMYKPCAERKEKVDRLRSLGYNIINFDIVHDEYFLVIRH